jgi:two-component system sensor histidine kinase HydH
MKLHRSLVPRYATALLAMLLPFILVYSSLRTFRELDRMKSVFLRNRSAAIAARLETLQGTNPDKLQEFAENEPGLLDLRIISQPGDPGLADLWNGRQLFRTDEVSEHGKRIFRSCIPFHSGGQLRIAQIDLDAASADFLLLHARHNILIATVSSGVIVLLAGYALWLIRRAAAEEKKHLELAHLAHLGEMSAVLAHEIRTPLATIKGFTQLALEQAAGAVRPMLEPVLDETQRLERLVSDLLLYGRPPAPSVRESSWDEIAAPLAALGTVVSIEPASVRFSTDPDLLRHVLGNLIKNAVEAGAACVNATARMDGDALVITVEDNGPGIPADSLDKVFESFFTTKAFGTGLGLSIAKSLTAALGGTLALSARDSRGISAEVRLSATGAQTYTEANA